jgi:hypothetical protein
MGKKPDIIVFDEQRGWYASKLPYGSSVGSPVIKADDIEGWRVSGVIKANKHFESRFDRIRREYAELVEDVRVSEMVYSAAYNFEPLVGSSYFLYMDDNGNPFLSLINPKEWKSKEFIGEFRLNDNNSWEKVSNPPREMV